jgi:hypothetical protein
LTFFNGETGVEQLAGFGVAIGVKTDGGQMSDMLILSVDLERLAATLAGSRDVRLPGPKRSRGCATTVSSRRAGIGSRRRQLPPRCSTTVKSLAQVPSTRWDPAAHCSRSASNLPSRFGPTSSAAWPSKRFCVGGLIFVRGMIVSRIWTASPTLGRLGDRVCSAYLIPADASATDGGLGLGVS